MFLLLTFLQHLFANKMLRIYIYIHFSLQYLLLSIFFTFRYCSYFKTSITVISSTLSSVFYHRKVSWWSRETCSLNIGRLVLGFDIYSRMNRERASKFKKERERGKKKEEEQKMPHWCVMYFYSSNRAKEYITRVLVIFNPQTRHVHTYQHPCSSLLALFATLSIKVTYLRYLVNQIFRLDDRRRTPDDVVVKNIVATSPVIPVQSDRYFEFMA